MPTSRVNRPAGVTALSCFFAVGAAIAATAAFSLLLPGGVLEPMWRVNPRAREAFRGLGSWAAVLLGIVSIACVLAAVGLWKGRPWGRRVASALMVFNLVGDAANATVGGDRRAAIGVPIAIAILWFLQSRRVRAFFAHPDGPPEMGD